jgi:hypothetical protein
MAQIGPRRRPEVLADMLPDGSAVLFDPREEMVYAISATGAHLWDACDGTRRLPELAASLASIFETDSSSVEAEVSAFVNHLETLDLLEPPIRAGA